MFSNETHSAFLMLCQPDEPAIPTTMAEYVFGCDSKKGKGIDILTSSHNQLLNQDRRCFFLGNLICFSAFRNAKLSPTVDNRACYRSL